MPARPTEPTAPTRPAPALTLRGRVTLALAVSALVALAALSAWHGGRAAVADARSLSARALVTAWREGGGPAYSPALWAQTRDQLQAALRIAPDNAQLHDDMGFLYAARAQGLGQLAPDSAQLPLQHSLLQQASASYRAATALRPTFPYSWAYLALAKHLRAEHDAEFWLAFDKALQYGRNEAGVQPALAQMAFALWPALHSARQARVIAMVGAAAAAPQAKLRAMAAQSGVSLPAR